MYDFDTARSRTGHGSIKWDAAQELGCPPNIAPLSLADMEFCSAPAIVQAARELVDFGMWGYTHADDAFKAATQDWMQRRHGWNADPAWMVNTSGVVPAIYAAVRAFTQPGDGIIVQPPVYTPFFDAINRNGRRVVLNPLRCEDGNYTMDFADLRTKAKDAKMLVLCSPHNPVGRVWHAEELEELAAICRETGLLVFADEIHCDIVFAPHKHIAWATLKNADLQNSLIGTAASKTFSLAGLGTSSIFIPNEKLRAAFTAQQDKDGAHFNSSFGVAATTAAYAKGEAWMEEMIAYVGENYTYMKETLATELPQLKVYPLEGTYLAWVDFRPLGLNVAEQDEFLRQKAQLYLSPGHTYGPGGEGFQRINLACPRSVLQGALQRLKRAIDNG